MDLYGKKVDLLIDGDSANSSLCGSFITVLMGILVIAYTAYMFRSLTNVDHISFKEVQYPWVHTENITEDSFLKNKNLTFTVYLGNFDGTMQENGKYFDFEFKSANFNA